MHRSSRSRGPVFVFCGAMCEKPFAGMASQRRWSDDAAGETLTGAVVLRAAFSKREEEVP